MTTRPKGIPWVPVVSAPVCLILHKNFSHQILDLSVAMDGGAW